MSVRKLFFAFIVLLSLTSETATAFGEAFRWPLDIEISPSSSFCEARGLRFHGGVDLRTRLQTGFPVRAPADGFVSRIKVEWRGFGYALYIDHPKEGVRSVYGHLDDFAEPVAEYVKNKLAKMGARYGIDDTFGPNRFPVKQGQIVAYTGETGLGPPHLHFELRRFNDDPISPTTVGLKVPDKIPPEFLAIYIDPLAYDARINGAFLPVKIPLLRRSDSGWGWDGTPSIEGKCGISVGLVDNGEGGNRFGVERIALYLHNRLLLERIFNVYSYSENSQAPWIYDYKRTTIERAGYVYTMFKWPFETLRFSEAFGPWSGVLGERNDGIGELAVRAVDFGGNEISARGLLNSRETRPLKKTFDGALNFLRCRYNTFGVVVEAQLKSREAVGDYDSVRCTDSFGKSADLPAFFNSADSSVQIAFPNEQRWAGGAWCGCSAILPPHVFVPVSGGIIESSGARVIIPSGSLNFPILARLKITNDSPAPGGSKKVGLLPPKSGVWTFWPDYLVTAKPIRLEMDLGDMPVSKKLGIYEVDGKSKAYVGGTCRENTIFMTTRCLRPFVILEDAIPPSLTAKPRRSIKRLGLCAVYGVGDVGEGVDYQSARATVDGRVAMPDSDPDKSEIYVPLGKGANKKRVVLSISDNAGNVRKTDSQR